VKAKLFRHGLSYEAELTYIGKDSKGRDAYLSSNAALDFARMSSAAARDGIELIVNTAWRDHEWQMRLYADYEEATLRWFEGGKIGKRPLAPSRPGFSRHEMAEAVDLDLVDDLGRERPAKAWLKEHAREYSFVNPINQEPWHWEHDPLSVFKGGSK
jgi:LAS superfamily LD-carboxypeptidase LdcB